MANRSPDKEYEDNDCDEVASTVSELSGLSELSNLSSSDYKPHGPYAWILKQMESGMDPRELLSEILPRDAVIPPNLSPTLLWRLVFSLLNEPPIRSKLDNINTMDDVLSLLQNCKNIIVLTGAGVSVSCGIPDFRSRNGVYARLSQDYPDLPDPQAMFDIQYFRKNPRPFFKFAKEIYPGQFRPSPSHYFIKQIESNGKLLRNYTQNIDTLEHIAGIQKVITCHGSFATATCTVCRYRVDSSFIKEDIFDQRIPYCPVCPSDQEERGIVKPDIVFFGEGLSDEFHDCMAKDKEECDLLIVMGSSLKVRPVALIPNTIPPHVPQVLINREPLKHLNFDVELLGDCDVIIAELCRRLGWSIEDLDPKPLTELASLPEVPSVENPFHHLRVAKSGGDTNQTSSIAEADTTTPIVKSGKTARSPLPEEESNSCDCRGMSAIKLDDSQDGSNVDLPSNPHRGGGDVPHDVYHDEDDFEHDVWPSESKTSISTSLPENSYLFLQPNRYVFHGAEVYQSDLRAESSASPKRSPYHAILDTESSSSSSNGEDDEDDDDSTIAGSRREKIPQDLQNVDHSGETGSTGESSSVANCSSSHIEPSSTSRDAKS